MVGGISSTELLLVGILASLLIWPAWRICRRAGFPGWFGLAVVVPVLNVVLLYAFAFVPWPSLNSKRARA
jgi:hypothetical protein